ncbi:MAG: hypothetical protein AAB403_10495, partial [Planctomycetota bacterium]
MPVLGEHYRRWLGNPRCVPIEAKLGVAKVSIFVPKKPHDWITSEIAQEVFSGTAITYSSEDHARFVFEGPEDVFALPGLTDYRAPRTIALRTEVCESRSC